MVSQVTHDMSSCFQNLHRPLLLLCQSERNVAFVVRSLVDEKRVQRLVKPREILLRRPERMRRVVWDNVLALNVHEHRVADAQRPEVVALHVWVNQEGTGGRGRGVGDGGRATKHRHAVGVPSAL